MYKQKEGEIRLDIRNEVFTGRGVTHWHRLPAAAVASPSLEVFKTSLDAALSNLL